MILYWRRYGKAGGCQITKESIDDLYDLKQINGLRSTVNKRHIEKMINDIERTIKDTYIWNILGKQAFPAVSSDVSQNFITNIFRGDALRGNTRPHPEHDG